MKLKQDSNATRASGVGAAHFGPGTGHMFGRRCPLLSPELEGSGGAGGSPGGTPPPGQGGDPPKNPPAGNGQGSGGDERKFTQADMDRAISDRLARANKSSGQQQQPAPRKTETETETSNKADNDPSWIFDLTDAIDAVSEETGVKAAAGLKKKMRADFARERPTEPNAWVKSWFSDVGLLSSTSATTTTNNAGDPKKGEPAKGNGSVPPLSDKGPPSGGPREFESITNPNDLTKGDIERLVAKHGEGEANRRIGALASSWLRTARFKLKPGK